MALPMKLKSLLVATFFLILLSITSNPTFAHAGPPYIYINGKLVIQNTAVAGSSLLKVPYVYGAESYLVGQKLVFTIDRNLLQVDSALIDQSKFTWNFGDNTTASTLETSHIYSKAGSYFISLKVFDPNANIEVDLESLQVEILPNSDYKLPKAVIKVDGKKINDPLIEVISVTKGQTLEFDASDSEGDIKSYKWDFGDSTALATGKKVSHTFNFTSPYSYSIFPLLRVEDSKGFINDNFAQISNNNADSTTASQTAATNDKKTSSFITFIVVGTGVLVFLIIGFLLFKNLPKKKAA